jgi:hypothetical protein
LLFVSEKAVTRTSKILITGILLMVGKSKQKLKLNHPLKARLANKMNVNTPLLSVGQASDQGCVSIFTKAKIDICDEKEIEITLKNHH